jgi:glycosyltransferase involved in cell wall biosynthesis
MKSNNNIEAVDIIIPVYNEDLGLVQETVRKISSIFASYSDVNIFVVNDGSEAKYGLDSLSEESGIKYLKHDTNRGYGSSLKTGIACGSAPWIAIVDADGSYPVEDLPMLLQGMDGTEMVVGARTGEIRHIRLMRRLPKKVLNILASYMAGVRIIDLNSGMRVFTRRLCYTFWGLLPRRFSFTSTMTMGALILGCGVKEISINYYKRVGKSSINPIHDTLRFINIIVRMGLLFYPMKLFVPVSFFLFLVGFVKGFIRDYLLFGYVGNASIMVILAALQIILMGFLAELVVSNRKLSLEFKLEKRPGAHADVGPWSPDA